MTHKSNAYVSLILLLNETRSLLKIVIIQVVHEEHLSHDRDPAMYAFHTLSDNENNDRKLRAVPVNKESDDHF